MSALLKFVLNVIATVALFLVFRLLLRLIPGFSEPLLSHWSAAEFLGMFAALILLSKVRRRLPILRLSEAGQR
ncbi:hypothetical protein [Altererythrobacter sp. C41]|uniref:hypothetical protein n=1 Tax=Altererythrobacter sp. C41 TaxID=2806021 RepID=UPI001932E714|nr:hypothetical protein [Altererythrobacter sp. C41]MBM0171049.1 hypothetical protein [Altererythrobacter sp. C41]